MKLIGVVRIGRDAEVRYTTAGDAIASFSGAFNYGRKGDDGKRPSQWVRFSLFGKRAEALSAYLVKGAQVFVTASEPHINEFAKKDGSTGVSFEARVDDIELIGARQERAEQPAERPMQSESSAPRRAPAASAQARRDAFDDDIPF